MDDADMGVALSVTSLVMALAQDQPEQYKGSYVKAAARMKRILVDGEYAADYLYYKVPCPWIQVKLLRLLQYFPPSGMVSCTQREDRRHANPKLEDTHVRELIRESLQKILNLALEMPKNVQQNNAQNAVLFEAINLIIHLDTEQALMKQISTRLGKFIQSEGDKCPIPWIGSHDAFSCQSRNPGSHQAAPSNNHWLAERPRHQCSEKGS